MKRGGPEHPKTKELAALLGVPQYAAVGLLETLFHVTAQACPLGDIGRWPNRRIAVALGWTDDADVLVDALIEAGWLDDHADVRLVVHDWAEHADEAVRKFAARRNVELYGSTCLDKSRHVEPAADNGGNRRESAAIPIPIPIPIPIEEGEGGPSPAPPVFAEQPELARYWPRLRERIAEAHPKARLPEPGSAGERVEQSALEALVRLDGFVQREVVAVLEWVWTSTDRDAVFWRQQVCGLRGLRERKRGSALSKFGKIHEAWGAARSRARPEQEQTRVVTNVVLEPFGGRRV